MATHTTNTPNTFDTLCPDCGEHAVFEYTNHPLPSTVVCDACGWTGEDYNPEAYADDPMDGDHASALASVGWGTDEDYGCFDGGGDDWF